MTQTKIGFIGGGNMAASLIGGLIADGWAADSITVSDPEIARRETLSSQFSVHTTSDNCALVSSCDVVVLAIKPQLMQPVCTDISPSVQQSQPLMISIAAGIPLAILQQRLGGYQRLIRTMPNTPAMVQAGATALYAFDGVSTYDKDLAETIMRAVGIAVWVEEESLMDVVTAVSGSGPAYFFYIMEAMEKAAMDMGLSPETARLLTIQTAFGAAKIALESDETPGILRQKVTSPGGTTERALDILNEAGVSSQFADALLGARQRAEELAKQLGQTL